jgi:D-glycero-alpha-D-manno-heptose-7-phosphate kinase
VSKIEIKSPTRVDLAGGTLDLWPLNQFVEGATTLNVAIDVWTHATLEPADGHEIVWDSQDLKLVKKFANLEQALRDPDPKLILFQSVLKFFKPREGFKLKTKSESPVGGGLGGSSSLTISMMKAFSQWLNHIFESSHEMVNVAHNLEAFVLNTPTGTQDYYPAVSGGLNILKYGFSGIEQTLHNVADSPLKDHFMLVYTGKSHHSGLNNFEVMKSAVQKETKTMTALKDLKIIAEKMEKSILAQKWDDLPELFNQEFDARVRLAPAFTSPEIEHLNKITLEAGADAVKICGAGGGGCILVWCAPDHKPKVVNTCQKAGFQVMSAQPVNKLIDSHLPSHLRKSF